MELNVENPALKKKPSEYLRQLYYNSMVFTSEGLRHLIAEIGGARSFWGLTIRFRGPRRRSTTSSAPGLSDAERAAMLGETAEKLLAIKPALMRSTGL